MAPTTHALTKTVLESWAIYTVGSILGRSWRCATAGSTEFDPLRNKTGGVIYAFWHSRLLLFTYAYRHCGMTAVVSGSRDGEMAARAAQLWGHQTIRGSSSKNGMAVVRQCVRALRGGSNITVIPDGPKGPKEIVKPGIAEIALLSGATVVPVRAEATPCWRLSSWDRMVIPRPFSRLEFTFTAPLRPQAYKDKENALQLLTADIQEALA